MTYPDPRFTPTFHKKLALILIVLGLILARWNCARGETVLMIAQSQIGLGEMGGNNKGIYVRRYLNGAENMPWCAGFVSYCVREAGYDLPYLLRAKSYLKYGQQVSKPQAGDLMVFSRKDGGHIAIIEKVNKDAIITIEGNKGDYPAVVKRVKYDRHNIKNLLAFVRLEAQ